MVENLGIPAVLKSGNHAKIAEWRKQQSLGRTQQRRPDLLKEKNLSKEEEMLLSKYFKGRVE